MTLTKTMKTKLVLGIMAAALSLSLAIGGTLMLFTAQSEEATNVVTLGAADIVLQEATTATQSYEENWTDALTNADYKTVGVTYGVGADAAKFTGIKFKDNAVPGDAFAKAPRVGNTGNVPVYVKVEGALKIDVPEDADWAALNELGTTDYNQFFGEYFEQVVLDYDDTNWDGAPITVSPAANDDGTATITVNGTWYYTDVVPDSSYGTLKVLDAKGFTEPIFTGIELPTAIPNAFKNFKFSFDITAYAVQSDNNAPVGDGLVALESVFVE